MYIFETDGDYVNFNGGGNLWRIHKNSQCIAWHWDETGDLFFDVYDQQYIVKAENIATVTIGGVTLSTAADFETNIKLVFPGLAGGAASSSILRYNALFTQDNTDNPTIYELSNTIATCTWVRDSLGIYKGTFNYPATIALEHKLICNGIQFFSSAVAQLIPVTDYVGIAGYYILTGDIGSGNLVIFLEVLDSAFQYAEFHTIFGGGQGGLIGIPEIKIYP